MRKAIYILIFLIVTPGIFAKCPDFFIEVNSNTTSIDFLEINGTCYIELNALAELLRDASPDGSFTKLKAHPESFFSLIETKENIYIVQMNVPTVARGEAVYLSGKSFFKSLDALGVMNLRIVGENIKIGNDRKTRPTNLTNKHPLPKAQDKPLKTSNNQTIDEDRIYDSMVETMRELRKRMNSPESIHSESGDTIEINYVDSLGKRPPGQYAIPGKLKK